jgi:hypothetical protein
VLPNTTKIKNRKIRKREEEEEEEEDDGEVLVCFVRDFLS